MRPLKLRGSKFGNKAWEYGGRTYHSRLEANYAAKLDMLKLAGEVWDWWPQPKLALKVAGIRVCFYSPDFLVWYADGRQSFIECKGYETPVSRLKRKLFAACFPNETLEVVKKP